MEQPYRPPTPEEAVGQYGDLVYRLAYAKTGSRSDADDIYQEVFLRYLRKSRSWKARSTRRRGSSASPSTA